jgi:GNAT superfamily N-acetyltransferase
MTSLNELRPAAEPPEQLDLEDVPPTAAHALRTTYGRVWKSLASGGRMAWSDDDWRQELSRPGVAAWLARIGGEVAGLVEIETQPTGDVGIVVFGLVPEFRGKGFGGTFLTTVTRLAWQVAGSTPTHRVWLQTSSADHPNAMPNYIARGFRVFRADAA